MASPTSSRFGINIFCHFLFLILFLALQASSSPVVRELASILIVIAGIFLVVGLFYGFFRMFEMRIEGIEDFYQNFPIGFGMKNKVTKNVSLSSTQTKKSSWQIDWNSIFSFRYLRYAGILLIITAIFSLLFKIEWQLIHKIIASIICGMLFLGFAEFLRSKQKLSGASIASLVGIALLQFSLTLLYSYAIQFSPDSLPTNPHIWLAAKFILALILLFTIQRYSSDFHLLSYALIVYTGPLTLLYMGASILLLEGSLYLLGMTILLVILGLRKQTRSLLLLNTFLANAYLYFFYTAGNPLSINISSPAVFALFILVALFLIHLGVAVQVSTNRESQLSLQDHFHPISAHALILLGLFLLRMDLPFLQTYLGITYLCVSFCTFAAYIILYTKKAPSEFIDLFLNLAVLLSAFGLFLQVEGTWSAVIFLLYACIVLWFSLFNAHLRTRLYGFAILTLALFKLYWEFSDIFESIPGTISILVIGMILVGLSYKFEALKGLVLEGAKGMKKDK